MGGHRSNRIESRWDLIGWMGVYMDMYDEIIYSAILAKPAGIDSVLLTATLLTRA